MCNFDCGRLRPSLRAFAFVRAVPKSAITLRYIGCGLPWGKHRLLAHPPQRFARTSNSSPPFSRTLEALQSQPLHCTARASNRQLPRSTLPHGHRQHRNRPEACTGRAFRPPIRSPPAFLSPGAVATACLKILHHLRRVSLPTCDWPALTALTPSQAATSFHVGPSISLYIRHVVLHIITIRPFGAPPHHHHYPYTQ